MDLQPSGNNREFLFIETDDVYISIKGNQKDVGYSDENSISVSTCDNIVDSAYNSKLHLKEYKNYEIIIESINDSRISFYHSNRHIRDKVTPTGRSGKMLSGIINFGGDIGYSDLIILVNGREHIKIVVEVYPAKIDYKEDYKNILKDVNKEIYNLSYGFLSKTYLGAEVNNKSGSTYAEFYSILDYVFEKLIKSLNIIMMNPHHTLIKENKISKYHNLKNVSQDTIKWLEKRPHLLTNRNGAYLPTEALQVTKKVTLNSNENKFLKFILIKIIEKINNFQKHMVVLSYLLQ